VGVRRVITAKVQATDPAGNMAAARDHLAGLPAELRLHLDHVARRIDFGARRHVAPNLWLRVAELAPVLRPVHKEPVLGAGCNSPPAVIARERPPSVGSADPVELRGRR